MAAPHVAGAFAVLRQAHPNATIDQVLRALSCTGTLVSRNNLPLPRINIDLAHQFLENEVTERVWTFRSNREVRQWEQRLGTWFRPNFRNHMRVRGVDTNVWHASSSPFCSHNLRVDARMRRYDDETSFHWNSGLFVFSAIDSETNASGLWFAFNKLGSAYIWALDSFNLEQNAGGARLLCSSYGVAINVELFNDLRVVSRDGNHRFLINGTEVCSATDTSFATGDVGVVMAAPGNDSGHIFDVARVEVRSLSSWSPQAEVDPADSAAATSFGSYQTAPEGGTLLIPEGMTPLGDSNLR